MNIDNETLFWIAAGIGFIFLIMGMWIWGKDKTLWDKQEYICKLEKENKEWKDKYDIHIGKSIKEILSSIDRLEIKDLRDSKNKLPKISFMDDAEIYWNERPDEIGMNITSKDGFEFNINFNKKI